MDTNRRLALVATLVASLASSASHAAGIVYVNRCAGGCTIFAGPDNATTSTSSVVSTTESLAAFAYGDAAFGATVACIARDLAPFNFTVVTSAPGVPHHQIALAGQSAQLGLTPGLLGIGPRAPGAVIQNDIVFAFANEIGNDPSSLCWIATQQLA